MPRRHTTVTGFVIPQRQSSPAARSPGVHATPRRATLSPWLQRSPLVSLDVRSAQWLPDVEADNELEEALEKCVVEAIDASNRLQQLSDVDMQVITNAVAERNGVRRQSSVMTPAPHPPAQAPSSARKSSVRDDAHTPMTRPSTAPGGKLKVTVSDDPEPALALPTPVTIHMLIEAVGQMSHWLLIEDPFEDDENLEEETKVEELKSRCAAGGGVALTLVPARAIRFFSTTLLANFLQHIEDFPTLADVERGLRAEELDAQHIDPIAGLSERATQRMRSRPDDVRRLYSAPAVVLLRQWSRSLGTYFMLLDRQHRNRVGREEWRQLRQRRLTAMQSKADSEPEIPAVRYEGTQTETSLIHATAAACAIGTETDPVTFGDPQDGEREREALARAAELEKQLRAAKQRLAAVAHERNALQRSVVGDAAVVTATDGGSKPVKPTKLTVEGVDGLPDGQTLIEAFYPQESEVALKSLVVDNAAEDAKPTTMRFLLRDGAEEHKVRMECYRAADGEAQEKLGTAWVDVAESGRVRAGVVGADATVSCLVNSSQRPADVGDALSANLSPNNASLDGPALEEMPLDGSPPESELDKLEEVYMLRQQIRELGHLLSSKKGTEDELATEVELRSALEEKLAQQEASLKALEERQAQDSTDAAHQAAAELEQERRVREEAIAALEANLQRETDAAREKALLASAAESKAAKAEAAAREEEERRLNAEREAEARRATLEARTAQLQQELDEERRRAEEAQQQKKGDEKKQRRVARSRRVSFAAQSADEADAVAEAAAAAMLPTEEDELQRLKADIAKGRQEERDRLRLERRERLEKLVELRVEDPHFHQDDIEIMELQLKLKDDAARQERQEVGQRVRDLREEAREDPQIAELSKDELADLTEELEDLHRRKWDADSEDRRALRLELAMLKAECNPEANGPRIAELEQQLHAVDAETEAGLAELLEQRAALALIPGGEQGPEAEALEEQVRQRKADHRQRARDDWMETRAELRRLRAKRDPALAPRIAELEEEAGALEGKVAAGRSDVQRELATLRAQKKLSPAQERAIKAMKEELLASDAADRDALTADRAAFLELGDESAARRVAAAIGAHDARLQEEKEALKRELRQLRTSPVDNAVRMRDVAAEIDAREAQRREHTAAERKALDADILAAREEDPTPLTEGRVARLERALEVLDVADADEERRLQEEASRVRALNSDSLADLAELADAARESAGRMTDRHAAQRDTAARLRAERASLRARPDPHHFAPRFEAIDQALPAADALVAAQPKAAQDAVDRCRDDDPSLRFSRAAVSELRGDWGAAQRAVREGLRGDADDLRRYGDTLLDKETVAARDGAVCAFDESLSGVRGDLRTEARRLAATQLSADRLALQNVLEDLAAHEELEREWAAADRAAAKGEIAELRSEGAAIHAERIRELERCIDAVDTARSDAMAEAKTDIEAGRLQGQGNSPPWLAHQRKRVAQLTAAEREAAQSDRRELAAELDTQLLDDPFADRVVHLRSQIDSLDDDNLRACDPLREEIRRLRRTGGAANRPDIDAARAELRSRVAEDQANEAQVRASLIEEAATLRGIDPQHRRIGEIERELVHRDARLQARREQLQAALEKLMRQGDAADQEQLVDLRQEIAALSKAKRAREREDRRTAHLELAALQGLDDPASLARAAALQQSVSRLEAEGDKERGRLAEEIAALKAEGNEDHAALVTALEEELTALDAEMREAEKERRDMLKAELQQAKDFGLEDAALQEQLAEHDRKADDEITQLRADLQQKQSTGDDSPELRAEIERLRRALADAEATAHRTDVEDRDEMRNEIDALKADPDADPARIAAMEAEAAERDKAAREALLAVGGSLKAQQTQLAAALEAATKELHDRQRHQRVTDSDDRAAMRAEMMRLLHSTGRTPAQEARLEALRDALATRDAAAVEDLESLERELAALKQDRGKNRGLIPPLEAELKDRRALMRHEAATRRLEDQLLAAQLFAADPGSERAQALVAGVDNQLDDARSSLRHTAARLATLREDPLKNAAEIDEAAAAMATDDAALRREVLSMRDALLTEAEAAVAAAETLEGELRQLEFARAAQLRARAVVLSDAVQEDRADQRQRYVALVGQPECLEEATRLRQGLEAEEASEVGALWAAVATDDAALSYHHDIVAAQITAQDATLTAAAEAVGPDSTDDQLAELAAAKAAARATVSGELSKAVAALADLRQRGVTGPVLDTVVAYRDQLLGVWQGYEADARITMATLPEGSERRELEAELRRAARESRGAALAELSHLRRTDADDDALEALSVKVAAADLSAANDLQRCEAELSRRVKDGALPSDVAAARLDCVLASSHARALAGDSYRQLRREALAAALRGDKEEAAELGAMLHAADREARDRHDAARSLADPLRGSRDECDAAAVACLDAEAMDAYAADRAAIRAEEAALQAAGPEVHRDRIADLDRHARELDDVMRRDADNYRDLASRLRHENPTMNAARVADLEAAATDLDRHRLAQLTADRAAWSEELLRLSYGKNRTKAGTARIAELKQTEAKAARDAAKQRGELEREVARLRAADPVRNADSIQALETALLADGWAEREAVRHELHLARAHLATLREDPAEADAVRALEAHVAQLETRAAQDRRQLRTAVDERRAEDLPVKNAPLLAAMRKELVEADAAERSTRAAELRALDTVEQEPSRAVAKRRKQLEGIVAELDAGGEALRADLRVDIATLRAMEDPDGAVEPIADAMDAELRRYVATVARNERDDQRHRKLMLSRLRAAPDRELYAAREQQLLADIAQSDADANEETRSRRAELARLLQDPKGNAAAIRASKRWLEAREQELRDAQLEDRQALKAELERQRKAGAAPELLVELERDVAALDEREDTRVRQLQATIAALRKAMLEVQKGMEAADKARAEERRRLQEERTNVQAEIDALRAEKDPANGPRIEELEARLRDIDATLAAEQRRMKAELAQRRSAKDKALRRHRASRQSSGAGSVSTSLAGSMYGSAESSRAPSVHSGRSSPADSECPPSAAPASLPGSAVGSMAGSMAGSVPGSGAHLSAVHSARSPVDPAVDPAVAAATPHGTTPKQATPAGSTPVEGTPRQLLGYDWAQVPGKQHVPQPPAAPQGAAPRRDAPRGIGLQRPTADDKLRAPLNPRLPPQLKGTGPLAARPPPALLSEREKAALREELGQEAAGLPQRDRLVWLDLRRFGPVLTETACGVILDALQRHHAATLMLLDLRECALLPAAFFTGRVARFAKAMPALRHVLVDTDDALWGQSAIARMAGPFGDVEQFRAVVAAADAAAVAQSPVLDLRGRGLRDQAAIVVAYAVQDSRTIAVVDLRDNAIEAEGCDRLRATLQSSENTVTTVLLDGNPNVDDGSLALLNRAGVEKSRRLKTAAPKQPHAPATPGRTPSRPHAQPC